MTVWSQLSPLEVARWPVWLHLAQANHNAVGRREVGAGATPFPPARRWGTSRRTVRTRRFPGRLQPAGNAARPATWAAAVAFRRAAVRKHIHGCAPLIPVRRRQGSMGRLETCLGGGGKQVQSPHPSSRRGLGPVFPNRKIFFLCFVTLFFPAAVHAFNKVSPGFFLLGQK